MFFTILAYAIQIVATLGFLATWIFPFTHLLGPRLGASKKAIVRAKRAVKGRKWERKVFGIKDWRFWIE